ncbi:VanW family protein [Haloechinothrix sp. LS1_15]|uniref:VanW family protein n=1 Tax=Haloechinothrix sp. LS1_15 TaxID=2652248 RepID=UPI00294B3D8B|nr:VanW family protein [Haloechinothrix sp. LS1_15]
MPAVASRPRPTGRLAVAVALIAWVLGVVYVLDLVIGSHHLPRAVTVAGVDIGGMYKQDAVETLRRDLDQRLTEPATVTAGDESVDIDPAAVGIEADWEATVATAAQRPSRPLAWLLFHFTAHEVDPVVDADEQALREELARLRDQVERDHVEGGIAFHGTEPVAVPPEEGRRLNVDGAARTVQREWVHDNPITVAVTTQRPLVTANGVHTALESVARPAVAGDVTLAGADGVSASLEPHDIAELLRFRPDGRGGLAPELSPDDLESTVGDELAESEQLSRDASMEFDGETPTVRPSVDGRRIDWDGTAAELLDVLPGDDREVAVSYRDEPADITTEQARDLGIDEVVGEFSTGGFAQDSGVNIRRVAEHVDGVIVPPGETFSLNEFTGPRGTDQGYIEAGIIEQGEPGRAVGGGISQFATTLYNAAYFAAMTDIEHTEHSYYISRYPVAREATVYQDARGNSVIDLAFRNGHPTGIAIETEWTPTEITVRFWGTKHYEVESVTGSRTNFTSPSVRTIPHGEPCTPSSGSRGFTATDTRIIRDLDGEVVTEEERTVVYNPQPAIRCAPAPDPSPDPDDNPEPDPDDSPEPDPDDSPEPDPGDGNGDGDEDASGGNGNGGGNGGGNNGDNGSENDGGSD